MRKSQGILELEIWFYFRGKITLFPKKPFGNCGKWSWPGRRWGCAAGCTHSLPSWHFSSTPLGEDSICYFCSEVSAKIMKGVKTPGNLVKAAKMSYAWISEQLMQSCSVRLDQSLRFPYKGTAELTEFLISCWNQFPHLQISMHPCINTI